MRNPARGRKRRPTPPPAARRDADWSWRTPGAVVAALALVVAAVALYPAWKSARSDGRQEQLQASEAARRPALKVARVSAYIKDGIAGSSRDGNGGSDKENDLWGPHLDVTFENRASGPSLITKARLEFRQVGEVPTCSTIGGGLEVSANYDFVVPWPLPKAPYTMEKEISFQVESNALDRLTLTLGPAPTHGRPWYGVVDVVFEHDGGQLLQAGTVAVVDTGNDYGFYPDGDKWVIEADDRDCLAGTAKLVDDILSTRHVVASKELTTLQTSLRQLRP